MEAMFFKSQRLLKGYSINDLTSLNASKFTSCCHVSDDVIIKAKRYSEMGRGWLTFARKKHTVSFVLPHEDNTCPEWRDFFLSLSRYQGTNCVT